MIRYSNKEEMETLIKHMEETNHPNFKFANSSHSLWIRFKIYEEGTRDMPFVIIDDEGDIAAVCMITTLKKQPYANLYEIFAVKKGYATELYWGVMENMKKRGVERLKMSCTPSSIGWHYRNGIVGWAVDPTGSIRVDVPICRTQEGQLRLRDAALETPSLVMPTGKQAEKLRSEENSFGPKKIIQVEKAIETMGEFYMRKHLIN